MPLSEYLRKNSCLILNCAGYAAFSTIGYITIALLPEAVDRGIHCGDTSVIYPYKEEIISQWLLVAISILPVAVMFTLMNTGILLRNAFRESSNAWKSSLVSRDLLSNIFTVNLSNLLIYNVGGCCCYIILELAKLFVGRYRPHFLSLCKPSNYSHIPWNSVDCVPGSLMLFKEFKCQNTEKKLESALKSFPSGHATMAFYCAAFGVSYLELMLRRSPKLHLIKYVLEISLIIAAWIVSFSRVADNHHHLDDVIAGAILGAVLGYFTFSSYSQTHYETLIEQTTGQKCELTGFARRSTGVGKPITNTNVAGSQSFDFASDSSEANTKYVKVDLDDVDGGGFLTSKSAVTEITSKQKGPTDITARLKKSSKGSTSDGTSV